MLVGIEMKGRTSDWRLEDSLAELEQLAYTAGLEVIGVLEQRLDRPNPATLIGSGKVAELVALRADTGAQVVVFDEELSPAQQREIERAIGDENVKVLADLLPVQGKLQGNILRRFVQDFQVA